MWIAGAVSSSVVWKACKRKSEEHLGVVNDKYSSHLEESYSMPNTVQMLWSSCQHPFTANSRQCFMNEKEYVQIYILLNNFSYNLLKLFKKVIEKPFIK